MAWSIVGQHLKTRLHKSGCQAEPTGSGPLPSMTENYQGTISTKKPGRKQILLKGYENLLSLRQKVQLDPLSFVHKRRAKEAPVESTTEEWGKIVPKAKEPKGKTFKVKFFAHDPNQFKTTPRV